MRRRDTASLTAAAALALSFAPTLMRRRAGAQLAVSAASVALGGAAGAATELLVMRLARELDGGEDAARAALVGAGAVATLAELPRDPHAAVAALRAAGLRAEVDDRTESIGRKIRDAELQKIPYMLVIGDREAEEGTVAVRRHGEGDEGTVALGEFVERLSGEVAERS